MIVAFDLDDTLYDEISFVRSGFRAVAEAASQRWNISAADAYATLSESLANNGRGRQFDDLLERLGAHTRKNVRMLITTYQHHRPGITLPEATRRTLDALSERPMYLVTDGHKVVQNNKVEALGLRRWFRHCYLTNRYGIRYQKPSPRVFELLLRREGCEPEDVVYIGDDPSKDFCEIRPLGFRTIRLNRGRHAAVEAPPEVDAEIRIDTLESIVDIIADWEREGGAASNRSSP